MAAELEGLIAGGTTRGFHIPLYALASRSSDEV